MLGILVGILSFALVADGILTYIIARAVYNPERALVKKSEWEAVKSMQLQLQKLPTPEEFCRYRSMAEAAYIITEGMIPDSGIRATKDSIDGLPPCRKV